jgi:hypothetical protein
MDQSAVEASESQVSYDTSIEQGYESYNPEDPFLKIRETKTVTCEKFGGSTQCLDTATVISPASKT